MSRRLFGRRCGAPMAIKARQRAHWDSHAMLCATAWRKWVWNPTAGRPRSNRSLQSSRTGVLACLFSMYAEWTGGNARPTLIKQLRLVQDLDALFQNHILGGFV